MMKRFTLFGLLLLPVLMFGCSGDDDDNGGNGPVGPPRVVAFHASSALTLTDVDDVLWGSATATDVEVESTPLAPGIPGRSERRLATAISDQVSVKAVTYNDTLYLRITWSDATFDVWRDRYMVIDTALGLLRFTQDTIVSKEDQLMVMFSGLADNGWDSWHWRVLTTAIKENSGGQLEGFAEGKTLRDGSLTTDGGNVVIALRNQPIAQGFVQPSKMHEDSSEFNGFILFLDESVDLDATSGGWSVGQFIPGWRIDSTVAGSTKDATRLSRWDTRAVADWSDGADQYVLVLCRPLDTGFQDDLVMADSAKVRVGITNNLDFVFDQGSTKQGFTPEFWIIF